MSEKDLPAEVDDEVAEAESAAPPRSKGAILMTIVALLAVTLLAAGAGGGAGIYLAGIIERTVTDKLKAIPEEKPEIRYSGDMILETIEPIVANLADPRDIWIRLETAMVFPNGALPNPQVTAAEIRQDIIAYARTLDLSQLEGPSALQHLREDLNERAAIRTGGRVGELVIQTLVIQ